MTTTTTRLPDDPLQALVLCLEAEYRALLADDAERLEAAVAQKERLLALLVQLPPAALGQPQGDGLRRRAQSHPAIARLRELNGRNALALAPRAARNRARLQFLQSALGRPLLYGADGAVRAPAWHPPAGR